VQSDFRHLAADLDLTADVCVIGGGAAGLAVAHALEGTRLRVLLLESGGLEPDPTTERLNEAVNVGPGFVDVVASRRRVLGGATRAWAGQCVPLDAEDFEPREWVPGSGWPIRRIDLEPFYRRAEGLLDIQGAAYDERSWIPFGLSPPAWNAARLRHRFTVWPRRVDLGRLTGRRLRASSNVHVVLHATAVRLSTDPSGRAVQSVELRALGGKMARARARVFVLAAGTIENARLLLLSDDPRANGLGNDHDLVGRYFQDHPNGFTADVRAADARWLQDRYGLLYRRGRRYLARMCLSPQIQRAEGVLAATSLPVFDYAPASSIETARELVHAARRRRLPERLPARLADLARDVPGLTRLAARRYLLGRSPDALPQRIQLHVFTEQAPNAASRVTLGDRDDALGARMAEVDWRLTDLEERTVRAMTSVASQEFGRLGLGEVMPSPDVQKDALRDCYHHIGTTRMSRSPAQGVVDPDCRVHGVANLYLSGASVFPTSSWASPTFTAIALSLRLAEHLRRSLAS
jgi:choline dehydrogenase-like flavoprotein